MTDQTNSCPSLWQRIVRTIVQVVPVENGRCEFDCRDVECSLARWRTCENRIRDVKLDFLLNPASKPKPGTN